jgi:hypothetical protein
LFRQAGEENSFFVSCRSEGGSPVSWHREVVYQTEFSEISFGMSLYFVTSFRTPEILFFVHLREV